MFTRKFEAYIQFLGKLNKSHLIFCKLSHRAQSLWLCTVNMAFPTFMTQFISFIVLLFIITPIIFALFRCASISWIHVEESLINSRFCDLVKSCADLQSMFRVCSGYVQGMFRVCSEYVHFIT